MSSPVGWMPSPRSFVAEDRPHGLAFVGAMLVLVTLGALLLGTGHDHDEHSDELHCVACWAVETSFLISEVGARAVPAGPSGSAAILAPSSLPRVTETHQPPRRGPPSR